VQTFAQKPKVSTLNRPRRATLGPEGGEHSLFHLQRTIGDQTVQRALHTHTEEPNAGLTAATSPRFGHDFSRIPIDTPAAGVIQAKLAINKPGDEYEQEADHVSEQVMRTPEPLQRKCACCGTCADCEKEQSGHPREQLQIKRIGARDEGSTEAPAIVHDVLRSSGQPLDVATRAFMEPWFGFDFSRVRVHSGAAAEQSTREVSAHAYTVGHSLVFGAGAFAPGTGEGRRLIAHELAHVVQQAGPSAGAALQRDPKEDEKKKQQKPVPPVTQPTPATPVAQDVAVLLAPDEGFVTLAAVIAPGATILRATSDDDLAKQLKTIKGPIRTLYFLAHMTEDGDLMFTSPGKMTYVPAEGIAAKIKGSAQVESIDFRGCSIAQSPGEMGKIGGSLKATKVTGSTCSLVEQTSPPVKVNGKPITRPEQLADKKIRSAFDAGFKKVHELFVDKRKNCILNDSEDGYFKTGGKLIAYWANPGSMADEHGWDDTKSICYKDLKVEKVDPTKKLPVIGPDDCKLVELAKTQPKQPKQPKKT
jgi:hypothetical protein